MERHARGLPENLLELVGVLKARHLDKDALAALGLDGGLGRAERIKPAVEHLQALCHRGAHARLDTRIGQRGVIAAVILLQLHLADGALAKKARLDRRGERLQRLQRRLPRVAPAPAA